MSWNEVKPKSYAKPSVAKNMVALKTRSAPGKSDLLIHVVMISAEVFSRLKWDAADPVRVAWGEGSDAGKVRIDTLRGGGPGFRLAHSEKTGIARVFLSVYPDGAGRTRYDGVELAYECPQTGQAPQTPRALEIELPDDFTPGEAVSE